MESSKCRRMSMLPSSEPPSITINSVWSSRSAMMLSSSEGSSCRARKTTLMMETSGGPARAPPRKRRPPSMRAVMGSVKLTLCTRDSIRNKVWLHSSAGSRVSLRWLKSWRLGVASSKPEAPCRGTLSRFGAGGFAREVEWLIADKMCTLPPSWPALQVGAMKSVMRYMALPC